MSLDDPNPTSADDSPDKPAALAPDEPTVVRDIPEPVAVPEPSAAPEPPAAFVDAVPAAPPLPPVTDPEPALDELPQVTSSGLPNPHGLPEIAVERPEVAIGAAFAGGLVLAMILKRLAH